MKKAASSLYVAEAFIVKTADTPRPLDHAALRFVEPSFAEQRYPCSPSVYGLMPAVRAWLERR